MVLTWHLQNVESSRRPSGIPQYSPSDLSKAAKSSFAIGCAVGVEFPDHVPRILNQTHPNEVSTIISDCSPHLLEQITEAQSDNIPLGAELFLSSIFEVLEEGEPVELETTCNILSISFEYGCILSIVERRAAILVRNQFDRMMLSDDYAGPREHHANNISKQRMLKDIARKLVRNYLVETGNFATPSSPN